VLVETRLAASCQRQRNAKRKNWCARRDSNSRPTAPEAAALSRLSYGRTAVRLVYIGAARTLNARHSSSVKTRLAASPADCSLTGGLPKSLSLVIQRQQPVAWVVAFTASRAPKKGANLHPLTVVILAHRKASPAAAGDEEHAKVFLDSLFHHSAHRSS
jgi:hypothetical protein